MPLPLKLICLSVYDALAHSFAPTTDCFALIAHSIVVTHIHTHSHTHTQTHTHTHAHKFVRVSKTSGATVKNTSTFT